MFSLLLLPEGSEGDAQGRRVVTHMSEPVGLTRKRSATKSVMDDSAVTIKLPPPPELLKGKVNPYYEKDGPLRNVSKVLPEAQIAAVAARLSSSNHSKALAEYERNVTQVVHRKPGHHEEVSLPVRSRPSSSDPNRCEKPPTTHADIANRHYTEALQNISAVRTNLMKRFLGPLRPHNEISLSSEHLSSFLERNYSRPVSRAQSDRPESRPATTPNFSTGRRRQQSPPRADYVEHFYIRPLSQQQKVRDELVQQYMAPLQTNQRALSPVELKKSVERLLSGGK